MSARDRILARLHVTAPAIRPPRPDIGLPGTLPGPGSVAEFEKQLTALHAKVIIAEASAWRHRLAEEIMARKVCRLLGDWQDEPGGELARALPRGVERVGFEQPIEAWKEELFDNVDAGFSVADAAAAASGTLIFKSGPRTPRTVSLVPPLHLVLLFADRLYADLPSALDKAGWRESLPTNLIMVSGPSKTADIQQTLAYGAHGPKDLVVVVALPAGERP